MMEEIQGNYIMVSFLVIPGDRQHAEHQAKMRAINERITAIVKEINQAPTWIEGVRSKIASDFGVARSLEGKKVTKIDPYFVSSHHLEEGKFDIEFLVRTSGDEVALVSFPYVSLETLPASSDLKCEMGHLSFGCFFTPDARTG